MAFSEKENRRKSLMITTALFVTLFILLFSIHMIQIFPDPLSLEGGGGGGDVAVNFGDSEVGSGDNFQSMESVQSVAKAAPTAKAPAEQIMTSDNDDAPSISDIKKVTEKPKKEEAKPVEKPAPKPAKSTSDALSNILNGSSKGGDGDDDQAGNKGKAGGNVNDRGYSGGGGSGTGSGGGNGSGQGIGTGSGYGSGNGGGSGSGNGNWKLAGRKLSTSGKVVQQCNESGTVVVEVKVNRNGDVIGTQYTKGTTNTDQCLLQPAYATAKKYKWLPNPDAPEVQTGTITINFKLGE
jgi:TonB family protein